MLRKKLTLAHVWLKKKKMNVKKIKFENVDETEKNEKSWEWKNEKSEREKREKWEEKVRWSFTYRFKSFELYE